MKKAKTRKKANSRKSIYRKGNKGKDKSGIHISHKGEKNIHNQPRKEEILFLERRKVCNGQSPIKSLSSERENCLGGGKSRFRV